MSPDDFDVLCRMFEMPPNSTQILCVYNMIKKMRTNKTVAAKILNLVSSEEGSDTKIDFKSISDLSQDSGDLLDQV